jgi:osmotically inducible protein OsmC
MKTLYTIKATSVGGRNGHVRSDYNLIDADVRLPKALGGKDDEHLTPEVFFAAGYAACFDNAVMHIIRLEKVISDPPVVTAKVDLLYLDSGMVGLAVELLVEIPGLDHEIATELVRKAHQICPYSNATRGNIEVKLTIK